MLHQNVLAKYRDTFLYIGLLQALVGMLGSLYFSEAMHFAPCLLCWYQRIALYPLVAIFAIGIYFNDRHVTRYAWPLAIVGFVIGAYHNLLYSGIIPERLAPCTLGVSCTTKFFEWGGFITIPFLSLMGFVVIIVALALYDRSWKHES